MNLDSIKSHVSFCPCLHLLVGVIKTSVRTKKKTNFENMICLNFVVEKPCFLLNDFHDINSRLRLCDCGSCNLILSFGFAFRTVLGTDTILQMTILMTTLWVKQ